LQSEIIQTGVRMADAGAQVDGEFVHSIVNDLISNLRVARQELRIPRDRVALGLGLSEITIVVWEAGRATPITVNFFRWAYALGYIVDIREISPMARPSDAESATGMRSAEYSLLWIARALRKARIETAVTQEALGIELGVSRWTVRMWESAQRTPLLPHLVQWCGSLNRRLVLTKS
jgi:DNA-binding XRE family transcriptional regulator